MDRRRYLFALSSSVFTAGAGCLFNKNQSKAASASTRTPTQSTPGEPTDASPYPPYTEIHTDIDQVIGTQSIESDTAPLYLESTTHSQTVPNAEYSFTLHNQGDRPFVTNYYSWSIHRWEAGKWWYVTPSGVKSPQSQLLPGSSYTWHLTVSNNDLNQPSIGTGGNKRLNVRGLGGGSYAFGIDGWWKEEKERKLVATTRFRVEANQLNLRPSTAVTDATRKGDTVTVIADRTYDSPSYPAVFVLERTSNTKDAVKTITEDIIRSWPLRDALAYAVPEIDRVRLEAPTIANPPFGPLGKLSAITYQGNSFTISATKQ